MLDRRGPGPGPGPVLTLSVMSLWMSVAFLWSYVVLWLTYSDLLVVEIHHLQKHLRSSLKVSKSVHNNMHEFLMPKVIYHNNNNNIISSGFQQFLAQLVELIVHSDS